MAAMPSSNSVALIQPALVDAQPAQQRDVGRRPAEADAAEPEPLDGDGGQRDDAVVRGFRRGHPDIIACRPAMAEMSGDGPHRSPAARPAATSGCLGAEMAASPALSAETPEQAVRVPYRGRPGVAPADRGVIHGLLGPNGSGQDHHAADAAGTRPPGQRNGAGRRGPAGTRRPPRPSRASRDSSMLRTSTRTSRRAATSSCCRPGTGPRAMAGSRSCSSWSGWPAGLESKVRGFSTGMRQRLGLAAALISDPAVIIVDEPTSGLDPAGVRDVHALLLAMAESGRTCCSAATTSTRSNGSAPT